MSDRNEPFYILKLHYCLRNFPSLYVVSPFQRGLLMKFNLASWPDLFRRALDVSALGFVIVIKDQENVIVSRDV